MEYGIEKTFHMMGNEQMQKENKLFIRIVILKNVNIYSIFQFFIH